MNRPLAALLLWLLMPTAQAHPLAPALLELRETEPARYEVLWRTSLSRAQGVDVSPQFPPECRASAASAPQLEGRDALVLRWTLDCAPAGLEGRELRVQGLDRGRINVIVQLRPLTGDLVQALLDAERPVLRVETPERDKIFSDYLGLGLEHLLLGLDHLLFVAGLVLLLRPLRRLVLAITAFTLGHSLTLTLATLGYLNVSQAVAETGIALSLLWLACEIARPESERERSWLKRWPGLITCAFGLLHGLGFAGALTEAGLPAGDLPLALLAFNLGIELGQLLVLALLALVTLQFRKLPAWPVAARLLPAYIIGTLSVYWCLERSSDLSGVWMRRALAADF